MKKLLKLTLIILLLFSLSACSNTTTIMDYNSDEFINLYDYNSICIDYDYIQITEKDIESIIETELSVNEAYIEISNKTNPDIDDIVLISINGYYEYYFVGSKSYTECLDTELLKMNVGDLIKINIFGSDLSIIELKGIYRVATIKDTDLILDYYGCSNMNEVYTFIKARAAEEITFNYSYEIICENSFVIKMPNEIQAQINSNTKSHYEEILEYYPNFEEFLKEQNITKEEFKDSISANYYEMMIYKAILDKESIVITQDEINNYRSENKLNDYSDYDIYKELAYLLSRDILVNKTQIIT